MHPRDNGRDYGARLSPLDCVFLALSFGIIIMVLVLWSTSAGRASASWAEYAQMVTPQLLRSESGVASTYGHNKGPGDASNQPLKCGGRLNVAALTAAHPRLPCFTRVHVTNQNNGRSVWVTINDHGPNIKGRIIDLSPAAAKAIGMGYGLAPVRISW